MDNLLLFVLGIIFIVCVLPIIESMSFTIQTMFEVIKSNMNVSITKNNKKIRELNEDLDQSPVSAIGFHIDDECGDYDSEECKQVLSSKNSRIGF